jgi:hypothetical protein
MTDTRVPASAVPAPPRWAVLAAWAVPLCVLPSAAWRSSLVVSGDVPLHAEGWYLVLLSALSLGLALLTVGLVQPWGERFPPRLVTTAALTGAALLTALCLYVAVNATFHLVDRGPVLVGPEDGDRPPPDDEIGLLYLPLLLWAPLLVAVTRDFSRRHRS